MPWMFSEMPGRRKSQGWEAALCVGREPFWVTTAPSAVSAYTAPLPKQEMRLSTHIPLLLQ